MSKVIMVQGTMSNAGKSFIAAGLCRIFRQDGLKAAPFKSQNMALNSYVTAEGLEMGRAQVVQAEAAGIEPSVLMNPILLKPTNDTGSQVIVNGEVIGNMEAGEYFEYKKRLVPDIIRAFNELAESADIIVIEGAGSPAEINLKQNDIVNMGLAKLVNAPVLLVGDIDRGGVFAQLLGTLELLDADERERVKGFIINKFRGDRSILDPGIAMLEKRCGVTAAGVVPFMGLALDDEDSLSARLADKNVGMIDIAVLHYPRISNFTDFSVFDELDGVSVRYVSSMRELGRPDMIVLPGSKNTMGDLRWIRENGLETAVKKCSADTPVFGICGGYQMLGLSLSDPYNEEEGGEMCGMGLLPVRTVIGKSKIRNQVKGVFGNVSGIFGRISGMKFAGYEIHMGNSVISEDAQALCRCTWQNGKAADRGDGCQAGNVCGTYIHGILDSISVAQGIVQSIAEKKGMKMDTGMSFDYREFRDKQYDRLAEGLRASLDMDLINEIIRNEADA